METLEQKIEALINEHGAEAFAEAVKKHSIQPDGPTTCPTGYVLVNGVCVLDVGK